MRLARRLALLAGTAVGALATSAPAAHADPFSLGALIATAITAASSGAIAGAAATAIGTIVAGALIVGAGLIVTALFTHTPKPENAILTVQEPISYRIFGWGQARVPGSVMHKEASAGFLGVVIALNAHLVSEFVSLFLDNDLVTVPIANGLINGNVSQLSDHRYNGNTVLIDTRKGDTAPGYYSIMAANFSDTWPTSALGKGIASLAMVCSPVREAVFTETYPFGQPKPSAVLNQALVFDPRDASQSSTNPVTWKFSDNPVLCALHWRCFSPYGSLLPYATAVAPIVANWIQAANDCDDAMALKTGGTEKRYRMGGFTTTSQARSGVTASILAACDGWMCDRGDGTVDIKVGKYYAPTVTLTDDDILAVNFQRGPAQKDSINRVSARYTSPANAFTTVETLPMDNTADQALRFGPPRALQMDVTWCQATGQASRLQKREFIRQGRFTRGQLTCKLSAINACFERWVLVNSNSISRLNGVVIEPSKPIIDIMTGRVTFNFINSGADIDTYTPATDESPAPYVPQRPTTIGLPIPANVSAVPETTTSNGTSTVFLALSWDTPLKNGYAYPGLTYVWQYRTSAVQSTPAGAWVVGSLTTTDVPASTAANGTVTPGRTTATTGAVPIGTLLDVQVFSEFGSGQLAQDGSVIVQVNTALVAPGAPSGLITGSPQPGQVELAVAPPQSSNLASIQFYRAPAGGSFGNAQPIGQPVAAQPNQTAVYFDTVAAGTYAYYATAIGTNGVASAPTGPTAGTSN